VISDVYVLTRFVPAPSRLARLARELSAPHAWLAQLGTDRAIAEFAGALLWLVACWLAFGLLASGLSQLPGRPGALARQLAGRLTPAAVRNLVLAATGASLLISPLAAQADPLPVQAGTGNSQAAPGWPISTPARPALPPPPTWPTGPDHGQPASTVTVHAGDSLWTIAAGELGSHGSDSQIAIEWPYWYRANRALIGRDPNLLQPGTQLRPPARTGSGMGLTAGTGS
jgi:hypothetical protein